MTRDEWLMIAAKDTLEPPRESFDMQLEITIIDCAIALLARGDSLETEDRRRLRKALKRIGVL